SPALFKGGTYRKSQLHCDEIQTQRISSSAFSLNPSHLIDQLEHLQSKYIGTGHADTSKWEWLVNQHRDSYCSYMGHFDLLNYFSVAENESKARVRFNLMEKMLQPCGPPADKPDDA
uniref:Splicing factor 3b, subunit 5 n=1 Tax=Gasterosteus aculeatus aculeatus TaxID=481459 RepID=G3P7W6_GASAC